MELFPSKPMGSVIEEREGPAGAILSWRLPGLRAARLFISAFLIFWMCGWVVGWVSAAGQIAGQLAAGGRPEFFLVAWLGGWTVGGGFVICMLWALFRPTRPEAVTLAPDTFSYDPGWAPVSPRWPAANDRGWAYFGNPFTLSGRPRRVFTVPKGELKGFVLERVGERQRLCFDSGADRVEIGMFLREPEREWLYAVLENWRRE